MNANAPHDAIDRNIDRALSALREAAPRPGLEGRILASLEHRAITPQSTRFHISAHIALWAATSAAILAIASLIVLHNQSTASHAKNSVILSERSESKNPEEARLATNSEPFSTTNLSQTSIEPTHRMAHRAVTTSPATPAACAQPSCPIHDEGAAIGMGGVSQTPTDTQLLADLHAPSHPAPPLPLTPQEKLFLSRLRYGNATQLAELDPIVRATHDDAAAAAFKAFFPDPPPLKQSGDPDDSN